MFTSAVAAEIMLILVPSQLRQCCWCEYGTGTVIVLAFFYNYRYRFLGLPF